MHNLTPFLPNTLPSFTERHFSGIEFDSTNMGKYMQDPPGGIGKSNGRVGRKKKEIQRKRDRET